MNTGKRRFCITFILFAVILFSQLLTSCSSNRTPKEPHSANVETDGQLLTIIFDENTFSSGTIRAENEEYIFQYDAQSNGITFTVTYPDGYVYSQTEIDGVIASTYDYDADERKAKGYIDGYSLEWSVDNATNHAQGKENRNAPSPIFAILLLGCGSWNLFAPKTAWWLARGWWYKNAEPSDLALMLYRIAGIALLFAGIICLSASF